MRRYDNPLEIPSIKRLTEWANSKVREYSRNHPKLPSMKIYKIPGSNGNTYTLTVSGRNVLCSCPGYVYRQKCKHTTKIRELLYTNP